MFALVENGQVVRTVREESIEWNGYTYSNINLLTPDERKAAGIYDFVTIPANPPVGQKAQGTTIEIGDGVVTEVPIYVDKTTDELAAETNAGVLAQIASVEAQITPRRLREAVISSAGATWLVERDTEIAALRATL